MTEPNAKPDERPWERLEELAEGAPPEEVDAFVNSLSTKELVRSLARVDSDVQEKVLTGLDPEDAADVLDQMPETQAVELLESLDPADAARIVGELASDEQADLLGDLEDRSAEAILAHFDPEEAKEMRLLSAYADNVAGGLMVTEYLEFPVTMTAGLVIDDLRANAEEYADYQVQYGYVTGEGSRLMGVLRMHDLLLARAQRPIAELMITTPVTVKDDASLEQLHELFDEHSFLGVPVVTADGALVGVVQRSAVGEALVDRSDSDYQKSQGIVHGEELRSLPVLVRSRRRLSWLSVNIMLNVVSASIISMYQETLAQVITLAIFLPIISDMSGNSGNQAVAVSMRELSLGLVRPSEIARVWRQEIAVGLINGCVLGLLIALVAILWKGSPWLGLVVGGALLLNTMIAVSLGGTIPLLLRRFGRDPALASGPILTTCTDMCGFFLALSFAAALLPKLQGM